MSRYYLVFVRPSRSIQPFRLDGTWSSCDQANKRARKLCECDGLCAVVRILDFPSEPWDLQCQYSDGTTFKPSLDA